MAESSRTGILLTPLHLLEAHCAAVALERAGLPVTRSATGQEAAIVVFARPEEVPEALPSHDPTFGPTSGPTSGPTRGHRAVGAPLLLVCPSVDDAALHAAARIGAAQVLAWDSPTATLVAAVIGLARGDARGARVPEVAADPMVDLTERELQIARLIGVGATNLGIAEDLGISYHTVRTHVGHLMSKLGVTHRYAIVPVVQRSERARRSGPELVGAVAR